MPTPVSTARQCLMEVSSRALDDAVAVARRRSHSQTTSLHAVSSLLALPSSTLREACARARSSAYSPRLQFRALELSVGVSLDRLPTTKAQEEPPISNSLMAAIKRSQANQRRHPETFHLYQQLQYQNNSNIHSNSNSSSSPSISTVKVELKHFLLSILDDPIVSRVFGEAGFRSCDIKIAILNPPTITRFPKGRCPPLFLCNLSDSELSKRGFSFPFSGVLDTEGVDENSRRIGKVLVQKRAKNPLLIGVCANDALKDFIDSLRKGKDGVLPKEIDGLREIFVGKEISEFLERCLSEEMLGLKFEEVNDLVSDSKGAGVVVNYGDLKVLVDGGESMERVNYVVARLSRLVEVHGGKLWLIGAAASYDTYMKFVAWFPSIEKEWDLHLLPITSSRPPMGGAYSRSGLMGSFVPFGGFFPAPSDFENTWSNRTQSTGRCNICNEKYEQEASIVFNSGSTVSVADQCSANLSSWLRMSDCGKSKKLGVEEAKDDRTVLNARLAGLQTKWNDICQRLHHNWSFQQDVSIAKSQVDKRKSSNTDSLFDERMLANQSSCMTSDLQHDTLPKPNLLRPLSPGAGADSKAELPVRGLKIGLQNVGNIWNPSYAVGNLNLPLDQMKSSSITSMTTDLGLGTLYASREKEPSEPKFQEHKNHLQNFSVLDSADTSSENASNHVHQSSSSSVPQLREKLDGNDFKFLWSFLTEKVGWQDEAVGTISQIVASCKNGHGRRHDSNKGNMWLSFGGPDKVGKRRIAASLAEATFGRTESFLRVDLGSLDKISFSNTIFERQDMKSYDLKFRGKTVVDYIVGELSKKHHSVVLLENIDKADFLVQNSLSQAIRTGRFPDSQGREISINNVIFVITSSVLKLYKDFVSGKMPIEYSEERILAAKDFKMQIFVGCASGGGSRINGTNLMVISMKENTAAKRKLIDDCESSRNRISQKPKRACEGTRSCFDLNLPVEEMEEDDDCDNNDSDSGSESSKAWLEDFLDQIDGNVTFKPFDFDALSQKVLKDISIRFQKIVGTSYLLEIDSEIIVQIVAAVWLSERKKAVEDWIEEVLCRGFKEARQRCQLTPDNVMKLIACEGLVEDHAPGICLPARIIIN